jgi:hypothetical protein
MIQFYVRTITLMSPFPQNFTELLDQLGTVFERYVPWHSEAEKIAALATVAATRAHLLAADIAAIPAAFTASDLPADLIKLASDVVSTPAAFSTPPTTALSPSPTPPESPTPTVGEGQSVSTDVVSFMTEMQNWTFDMESAKRAGMDMGMWLVTNPAPAMPGTTGTSGTAGSTGTSGTSGSPAGVDFVYPTMPEKETN